MYGRGRAAHHSCLVAATRIHAAICMGPCGDGRDLYGRTAVVLLYVWKRGSELHRRVAAMCGSARTTRSLVSTPQLQRAGRAAIALTATPPSHSLPAPPPAGGRPYRCHIIAGHRRLTRLKFQFLDDFPSDPITGWVRIQSTDAIRTRGISIPTEGKNSELEVVSGAF